MSVIELTTLEEIENAFKNEESFIKISTTTCGPCKMMSPLFEVISNEAKSGTFYSITADTLSSEVARYVKEELAITAVPVFFKYENGVQAQRVAGALPKSQLVAKLNISL